MALDQSGNYFADLPDEKRGTLFGGLPVKSGHGAPGSSTPVSLIYEDLDTGDLYTNPTMTAGAWVAVSSGGGGGAAITHGTGSPIDNSVSVVTYKIYIDETVADAPSLWVVSNSAWIQVLG